VTYYQLNSEKLRSGDVILEAGTGLGSKIIKLVDRGENAAKYGKFSHVFVYVDMNAIMEADEGVRMILASRVITETPDKFLVLRHPAYPSGIEHPEWAAFTKNLMFMALQPEVNKPYNWWGMLATKLTFLKGRRNAFFCSQLMAMRTDGNHRYSVTKNKRSPFVS
jgi:hypothetical protein